MRTASKWGCSAPGGRTVFYTPTTRCGKAVVTVLSTPAFATPCGKARAFFMKRPSFSLSPALCTAVLVLLAGCHHGAKLPYYVSADFTPVWDRKAGDRHRVAPFSFVDQNGVTVTEKT